MAEVEARYRYRLRVGDAQARLLGGVFNTCRFCWNQALGRWGDLWCHEGERLAYAEADRELTDWRSRYGWLAAQPSVPQQQVIRDLYRAIAAFFDKSNPAGRPRFKTKRDGYATARWTRRGFAISGSGVGSEPTDRLEVAVEGGRVPLRVVWSRPLPSEPSSVTVFRDRAGCWWASFVCRVELPDRPAGPTGRSTGLDLGLTTFATTEDPATDVPNPRFARAAAKKLARAQQQMARKQKGSNNRAKARRRKARIDAKTACQRADFHHNTARALVTTYDRIGVEDLRVKNMSRHGRGRAKTGLNRSIGDAGWAQFRRVLAWQAAKAGKHIVVMPARDTTQTCSCCGAKAKPRLELSDREFRCAHCGLILDRDRNAAANLNPDRSAPGGGTEPPGSVPVGDDGSKTKASTDAEAA